MTRRSIFALLLAPILPKRALEFWHFDLGFGGNQKISVTRMTRSLKIVNPKWKTYNRWDKLKP